MKALPAAPAATDREDDAEHREDALCRACARARTTVVPALGAALDHPLAQLLTGLLTVFALFGDDVRRSVYNERVEMASRPTESSRASTLCGSDAIDAKRTPPDIAGPHPRLRRRGRRRLHF